MTFFVYYDRFVRKVSPAAAKSRMKATPVVTEGVQDGWEQIQDEAEWVPRETGCDCSGAGNPAVGLAAAVMIVQLMLVEPTNYGAFVGSVAGGVMAGFWNGAAVWVPSQGDALIVREFLERAGVLSSNALKMTCGDFNGFVCERQSGHPLCLCREVGTTSRGD